MSIIARKVTDRLSAGIKRFQPILAGAKSRDVNESDTVIIVTDMLSEVFGYDKYAEITSECSIRGTFCDLGIKLDGTFQLIIEVKAIGLDLKEAFTRQAVDYASKQGTDWVVLTNGEIWKVHKMVFSKPIESELVMEINFLQLSPKKMSDLELLYNLTREGWSKSVLGEFHAQKQALNRFFIAAMLQSNPVLDVVRRELKRVSPNVKIDTEEIRAVLVQEVLKREVLEGEKAEESRKKIHKALNKKPKTRALKAEANPAPETNTEAELAEG